jgi:hypothetical protein
MDIKLNLKDVQIKEDKNGTFSYRINKTIKVEGIESKEKAIESVIENCYPLLKMILRNNASIKQFDN